MGFFRVISVVFFSVILSACGGGGGASGSGFVGTSVSLDATPDGTGSQYVGQKTAAKIDSQNADSIIQSIFGDNSFIEDNVQSKSTEIKEPTGLSFNTLSVLSQLFEAANHTYQNKHVDSSSTSSVRYKSYSETNSGSVSGSVSLSGDISDNGLGTLNMVWDNYDDGDGYVVNGKSTYQVVGLDYDYQVVTDVIQRFDALKISNGVVDVFLYGDIRQHIDTNTGMTTLIDNTDSYNSETKTWVSYDNVKYSIYSQSREFLIEGRLYRSDLGYVNISTINPLQNCFSCTHQYPISGGPLEITDDQGTKIALRPINEDKVRIEIEDNKGAVESQGVYGWNNLDGEPIANTAPQVVISMSPYGIATTNDDITATIKITEPDLDEVTTTIVWTVNDLVIEGQNSSVLPSSSFESGDIVRITVTVSDGNFTKVRSSGVSITNDRPVADAGSDQTLNIGDKIFLDARSSYDPDGQEITYKWVSNNNAASIVSPDQAQTEVIVSSSGKFTVTLQVSDGYLVGHDYVVIDYNPVDLFANSKTIDNFGDIDFEALKAGDVTGDGKNDLVYLIADSSNYKPGQIAVLKQLDDGSMASPVYYEDGIPDTNGADGHIEIADMDNDGLNDVMVLHDHRMIYYKQNISGTLDLASISSIRSFNSYREFRIGDMNNDGLKDAAIVGYSTNGLESNLTILFLKDANTFNYDKSDYYVLSTNNSELEVFDANGDGLEDVVILNKYGSNDILIFPQNESGALDEAIPYDLPYSISRFTYDDFNNNGLNDIAVVSSSGNQNLGILYQTTDYTFADPVPLTDAGRSPKYIKSGDINNDGLSDIVTFYTNEVSIYLQKSGGGFEIQQFFDFELDYYSTHYIDIADINNDGFLDIISTGSYHTPEINILYGKGSQ